VSVISAVSRIADLWSAIRKGDGWGNAGL
jgi:hypothetical protein